MSGSGPLPIGSPTVDVAVETLPSLLLNGHVFDLMTK